MPVFGDQHTEKKKDNILKAGNSKNELDLLFRPVIIQRNYVQPQLYKFLTVFSYQNSTIKCSMLAAWGLFVNDVIFLK